MEMPYGTDAEALASSLICVALLDQLIIKRILTGQDVSGLLRNARNALDPPTTQRETDAGWLIEKLISRFTPQNV
jgi:hypothetical protein